MSKLNDIQMFYKVKAGKDLYLDAPGPEDERVLDEDEKDLERRMHLKKGTRGKLFWDDPYAMATKWVQDKFPDCPEDADPGGPPWRQGPWKRGGDCAAERDKKAREIAASMKGGSKSKGSDRKTSGVTAIAAMQKAVDTLTAEQIVHDFVKSNDCSCTEDIDVEKVSDSLASLMSAAAGWAFSGDVTRGKDDHLKREWELHQKERLERERREEERRHRRRMKKSHDFLVLNDFFMKDRLSVPPRQGLLWDAVKHRWTRPENVGRTVTEVQGSKRFRGVGTGAHERRVGGHGSGATRGTQRGRRFRASTDVGTLRPHETKHAAQRGLKGGKNIRRQGHKKTYLKVLREHRNKQRRK